MHSKIKAITAYGVVLNNKNNEKYTKNKQKNKKKMCLTLVT